MEFMSINDRMMTQHCAHQSAALRVAVSGPQAAARGLNRRPASGKQLLAHCAVRNHLEAGHDNVAYSNRVSRS